MNIKNKSHTNMYAMNTRESEIVTMSTKRQIGKTPRKKSKDMPRGWLKHKNRSVGRKTSRGGGSRHNNTKANCSNLKENGSDLNTLIDDDFYGAFEDENYESDVSSSLIDSRSIKEENTDNVKQCPICCEERYLINLMKKCTHEPACYQCLREIFVTQAQQNVSNYPLVCYHPECRKPIHDDLLIRHNLVSSDEELKRHYRLKTLGQVYADSERKKVVYCPACEEPIAIKSQTRLTCRQCNTNFYVAPEGESTRLTTIAAMETSFTHDREGTNDGVAHCPKCNILISKGYGCDHMQCFCGHNFSWESARKKINKEFRNGPPRVATAKHISNL